VPPAAEAFSGYRTAISLPTTACNHLRDELRICQTFHVIGMCARRQPCRDVTGDSPVTVDLESDTYTSRNSS
jgi:hypothetical protein